MTFSKVYRNGQFSDLVKMYSFDRHEKEGRESSWNQTAKVTDAEGNVVLYALVGESVLLPFNQ